MRREFRLPILGHSLLVLIGCGDAATPGPRDASADTQAYDGSATDTAGDAQTTSSDGTADAAGPTLARCSDAHEHHTIALGGVATGTLAFDAPPYTYGTFSPAAVIYELEVPPGIGAAVEVDWPTFCDEGQSYCQDLAIFVLGDACERQAVYFSGEFVDDTMDEPIREYIAAKVYGQAGEARSLVIMGDHFMDEDDADVPFRVRLEPLLCSREEWPVMEDSVSGVLDPSDIAEGDRRLEAFRLALDEGDAVHLQFSSDQVTADGAWAITHLQVYGPECDEVLATQPTSRSDFRFTAAATGTYTLLLTGDVEDLGDGAPFTITKVTP